MLVCPKLRSLDPRPRARRRPRARPRSVGVFCGEESPIVPQLFCPVSLIVKHPDFRGRGRRRARGGVPNFRSLGFAGYGWAGDDSEVGLEVAEGAGKIGVGEFAGLEVILAFAWSNFDATDWFCGSRFMAF